MATVFEQMEALVQTITDRGIPATMDPRNADAPGAIVDLDSVGDDGTLCDRLTVRAVVYLIVPDHGHAESIAALLDLYRKVSDLTTGASVAELALPETAPLPALKLTPITLEED